jgi:hypothetical protein
MSDEKIKGTSTLKEALLDAERLLAHASEYGIEIDQKYIRAIINAKKNNQKNEWAEQDEIDFWVAFQVLAKAVEPVSIDSLRASSVMDTEKRSWWSKIWGYQKEIYGGTLGFLLQEICPDCYDWYACFANLCAYRHCPNVKMEFWK